MLSETTCTPIAYCSTLHSLRNCSPPQDTQAYPSMSWDSSRALLWLLWSCFGQGICWLFDYWMIRSHRLEIGPWFRPQILWRLEICRNLLQVSSILEVLIHCVHRMFVCILRCCLFSWPWAIGWVYALEASPCTPFDCLGSEAGEFNIQQDLVLGWSWMCISLVWKTSWFSASPFVTSHDWWFAPEFLLGRTVRLRGSRHRHWVHQWQAQCLMSWIGSKPKQSPFMITNKTCSSKRKESRKLLRRSTQINIVQRPWLRPALRWGSEDLIAAGSELRKGTVHHP